MRKLKLEELGRVDVDAYKVKPKLNVTIVLDNIRSGHNVGSVFRTCDGFALERVILCGISARPPHKEINKTAIGATSSVNWEYHEDVANVLSKLKDEDYSLIAIEQTDQSIELTDFKIEKNRRYAIVFGNEVEGVSESILSLIDDSIEIEQFGTKHSFNVSVCAGMVLHWFSHHLRH